MSKFLSVPGSPGVARMRRRQQRGDKSQRPFPPQWWALYWCFLAGVILVLAVPAVLMREPWGAVGLALLVLLVAGCLVWALLRRLSREFTAASRTSHLLEALLATSREWLWAIGPDGRFTFSGPRARELIGYDPSELLGQHFSQIIQADDLAQAMKNTASIAGPGSSWSGLVTSCRHRDGTRVLVEVSGRPSFDGQGHVRGFEGTTRALDAPSVHDVAAQEARAGVEAMLSSRTLLTAFQPIHALDSGAVIGAEALTRFLSADDPGMGPEAWFVEAASVGLAVDLEVVALQSALSAAASLPEDLYVAVNLSPGACLDERVSNVLRGSGIPLGRIVLELTEHHEVADYSELGEALAPLRRAGLRIAIDDAGAGFASMRHIVQLKPDVIKLDRQVIAGINADAGLRALGAAMVGFASEIDASLVAEGIETEAELATVRELGMNAAQGYLLGRPTVASEEWKQWCSTGSNHKRKLP
jgi:PAS domain S-box-containing protein